MKFIERLMNMPYYQNINGEHEQAVEKILQSEGFCKLLLEETNLTRKDILNQKKIY